MGGLEEGETAELEEVGELALNEGTRVRGLGGDNKRDGTELGGFPFEEVGEFAFGAGGALAFGVPSAFPIGELGAVPFDPVGAFKVLGATAPFPLDATGIRDSTGFLGVAPTNGFCGEDSLFKSSLTSRIASSFPPFE